MENKGNYGLKDEKHLPFTSLLGEQKLLIFMYGNLSGDELAKSVKLVGSRLESGEMEKNENENLSLDVRKELHSAEHRKQKELKR